MPKRYFCTSIKFIVFKKQILQASNPDLFNPLFTLSECQNHLFPLKIMPEIVSWSWFADFYFLYALPRHYNGLNSWKKEKFAPSFASSPRAVVSSVHCNTLLEGKPLILVSLVKKTVRATVKFILLVPLKNGAWMVLEKATLLGSHLF